MASGVPPGPVTRQSVTVPPPHWMNREAGPAGRSRQPQGLVGGEGQPVRLERVLDPGEQQLLHAHDRGDGGHVLRLVGPARRPLAECLGDRVKGLHLGHAANRMPSGVPAAVLAAPPDAAA